MRPVRPASAAAPGLTPAPGLHKIVLHPCMRADSNAPAGDPEVGFQVGRGHGNALITIPGNL
ncbi:hypothetical protein OKJ48_29225 [Streptomyces kunmingensis]|uniref:Uncharacterized protein n=1 Tax=Streptomyces kunmingensis TaxID=68225 RepID=A0ABU6CHT5_9ACTN|nr:hypothetical protein [Streptomyces kunmingensis]MEB3964288.1 hypothetical protein [Streptomyces kunmingensis]